MPSGNDAAKPATPTRSRSRFVSNMPRVKGSLNRIIDDMIHPRGRPTDIGTVLVDEALHSAVEGGFRLDKFLRYTVMPDTGIRLTGLGKMHSKRKCRKAHARTADAKCERCGQYVPFGSETWIDGKPYCSKCALKKLAEAQGIEVHGV